MIATCIYCGFDVRFDIRYAVARDDAHQALIDHDRQCPKNPLVKELEELVERRDSLSAELDGVIRDYETERHHRQALAAHVARLYGLWKELNEPDRYDIDGAPMRLDEAFNDAPETIDKLRDRLWLNPYRQRPAENLPASMALVPRNITAESGHKSALMGEFYEELELPCPECHDLDEADDGCEICGGVGHYSQRAYVDWSTIKAIHRRVVEVTEGVQ